MQYSSQGMKKPTHSPPLVERVLTFSTSCKQQSGRTCVIFATKENHTTADGAGIQTHWAFLAELGMLKRMSELTFFGLFCLISALDILEQFMPLKTSVPGNFSPPS